MVQSSPGKKKPPRVYVLAAAVMYLTGCGVAETGAVVATQGAAAAEQARQAEAQLESVQQRLDEAQAVAGRLRDDAETAAE